MIQGLSSPVSFQSVVFKTSKYNEKYDVLRDTITEKFGDQVEFQEHMLYPEGPCKITINAETPKLEGLLHKVFKAAGFKSSLTPFINTTAARTKEAIAQTKETIKDALGILDKGLDQEIAEIPEPGTPPSPYDDEIPE